MDVKNKNDKPVRLRRRKDKNLRSSAAYTSAIIAGTAIGTTILLLAGLQELVTETGALSKIRNITLAAGGGIISYGINRLAIERGAALAAIGYRLAGFASVASIALIGAGLWASTYPGMTYRSVAELQMQEYGTELVRFTGYRNRKATESARAIPATLAVRDEQQDYAQCEIESSCVSEVGTGGYGPVAKVLRGLATRADNIADTLKDGENRKEETLDTLNGLVEDYQSILYDTERSIWERRAALQGVVAKLDQEISDLDEAIPVATLTGYANELGNGVRIPGHADATRRLNDILARQSTSLKSVLKTLDTGDQTRPAFPTRAGVWTTFAYVLHFLPIAAIAMVVELVFPLALWVYTFLSLRWRIEQYEDDDGDDNPPDDGFGGLLRFPSGDTPSSDTANVSEHARDGEGPSEREPQESRPRRRYPPQAGRRGK